jgi:hypothetical protein
MWFANQYFQTELRDAPVVVAENTVLNAATRFAEPRKLCGIGRIHSVGNVTIRLTRSTWCMQ